MEVVGDEGSGLICIVGLEMKRIVVVVSSLKMSRFSPRKGNHDPAIADI